MKLFSRIDWYIIKKFLGTFFFSIVLILSIAIVFDLTEKLDDFFDSNAPLRAIVFEYYLNFIPYYMNMFAPLFIFISVIFFTSKMATNSEIIAMLAGGMSFRRIMFPYFFSAFLLGVGSFLMGGYVIPPASKGLLDFENKYVKRFKTEHARNVQMEVEPGVILYIESYQIRTNRGYRFSLEKFEDKTLVSRLTAERVEWVSDYVWQLEKYVLREFDGMREHLVRGAKMDTTIMVQPSEFFITSQEATQMTNPELTNYLEKQAQRGVGNIQAFKNEFHKRFASPIAAFIMTLIGVSLSSRKVRGGMGLHMGLGIALTAIYILFSTVSTSFSVNGSMSPFMAVWMPNFVFLLIGMALYWRTPK
ncbi:MAG: LptF/LptG family permease [Bacteroidaceae bacterium]|nr:LptF/LptG family permease [Bacteroidaceae bacterium]MBO7234319.1 LptF/LptG family permease [Paludibacteraceae bacterium]MBO7259269.1 LptF/LptG family permease [Paludibacteraceae bacterium]